jgi:hypothetical protein
MIVERRSQLSLSCCAWTCSRGLPVAVEVLLDALGEQLDVLQIARRVLRIHGQLRGRGGVAHGAVGAAAQRRRGGQQASAAAYVPFLSSVRIRRAMAFSVS